MTREEYYEILKERLVNVDKNSREEIKAYNEFAHLLRNLIYEKNFFDLM